MAVSRRQRDSHRFPDPAPSPLLPFELAAYRAEHRGQRHPQALADRNAGRRRFPGHPAFAPRRSARQSDLTPLKLADLVEQLEERAA
jgi:hypothetical protein